MHECLYEKGRLYIGYTKKTLTILPSVCIGWFMHYKYKVVLGIMFLGFEINIGFCKQEWEE